MKVKARLVAKGFSQKENVDYLKTYAPTRCRIHSTVGSNCVCVNELDIYHFDAEQAFLQSKLEHEILFA